MGHKSRWEKKIRHKYYQDEFRQVCWCWNYAANVGWVPIIMHFRSWRGLVSSPSHDVLLEHGIIIFCRIISQQREYNKINQSDKRGLVKSPLFAHTLHDFPSKNTVRHWNLAVCLDSFASLSTFKHDPTWWFVVFAVPLPPNPEPHTAYLIRILALIIEEQQVQPTGGQSQVYRNLSTGFGGCKYKQFFHSGYRWVPCESNCLQH